MSMQVTVEIPDSLATQLIPAGQDPARALLEDAALRAFGEDRISAYELRQLLGFDTRHQLDQYLKERGVAHASYTAEDLEQDVKTMDALVKKGNPE